MSFLDTVTAYAKKLWLGFATKFDSGPLSTVEELTGFIQTRAAFVAQTSLFHYIKARMSPEHAMTLEDETYAASLTIAKWHTYSACLADLTIFAVATCGKHSNLNDQELSELARGCFQTTVHKSFLAEDVLPMVEDALKAFEKRLSDIDWPQAADPEYSFTAGSVALLKWAPIKEEFKEEDKQKVKDAMNFRWRDSRGEVARRIQFDAMGADFRATQD